MKKALMVIDVQNEYFDGKLPIEYPENSFENIILAIESANKKDIPVILIQHTNSNIYSPNFKKGSKEWEIHEKVLEKDHDIIIEKNLPGSFTKTQLESYLKENDIKKVAICGYMTHMCCDTTARQAMHLDFEVEFLNDATGTRDVSNYSGDISAEKLHKATLITQAMKFSKVMSTEDWVRSLELI
jgi:nicotinamidase-related amidase